LQFLRTAVFVLVRVISWIILFGGVKGTIHETTRPNTKKTPKVNEFRHLL
jgi:hypothetical protein